MEEKQAKPEKFPWKQLAMPLLVIVVTVAIAVWMMLARIWPASVLIEKQAEWFDGKYYPKATFAIIWIGLMAILILLIAGIAKFTKSTKNENKI